MHTTYIYSFIYPVLYFLLHCPHIETTFYNSCSNTYFLQQGRQLNALFLTRDCTAKSHELFFFRKTDSVKGACKIFNLESLFLTVRTMINFNNYFQLDSC